VNIDNNKGRIIKQNSISKIENNHKLLVNQKKDNINNKKNF
jgi:hypothetical protein